MSKLQPYCRNGGPNVKSVKINGKEIKLQSNDKLELLYIELPMEAEVEITTTGGWPVENLKVDYPLIPALIPEKDDQNPIPAELSVSLKKPFTILSEMKNLLDKKNGME